ncbi:MAG: C40 family peptidase [Roseburia sp.]|nr:C40 family peptidase [Roseburia sp.]
MKKWKSAMCTMMAVSMLLSGVPTYIYAANSTEVAESTEIIATEADSTVTVTKRTLKALDMMEIAKEKINRTVAVLNELRAPYIGVAIAQVDNYVNVRAEANAESEVLGKLYDDSAATVLETTEDGWYKITSGSVTGYVKCEYVVVDDEQLAREVSTRYATVTTQTLNVRMEPSIEAKILTMLPEGDDFVVIDESMYMDGWVMVTTSEGEGYVSTSYVELWTDFVRAESKEEEEARLKKEEEARRKAAAAAAAARKKAEKEAAAAAGDSNKNYTSAGSSNGQAVVDYAGQFVGNPYVYGGTSLTNGADCSGFVMSVYAAFGVSLPHSSKAMRNVGYEVSVSAMQPGDIICYSGHVGIYVGNDTIVHASNAREGIKYTSPASYKSIICVRRIF